MARFTIALAALVFTQAAQAGVCTQPEGPMRFRDRVNATLEYHACRIESLEVYMTYTLQRLEAIESEIGECGCEEEVEVPSGFSFRPSPVSPEGTGYVPMRQSVLVFKAQNDGPEDLLLENIQFEVEATDYNNSGWTEVMTYRVLDEQLMVVNTGIFDPSGSTIDLDVTLWAGYTSTFTVEVDLSGAHTWDTVRAHVLGAQLEDEAGNTLVCEGYSCGLPLHGGLMSF